VTRALAWTALLLAGLLSFLVGHGLVAEVHAPELSRLPRELGFLHLVEDIDVAAAVLGDLPPERFLFARVADDAGNEGLLFVAWFERGRRWTGRPHSPEICFAFEGWKESEAHLLRQSDARRIWSRHFVRDEEHIRVVHWLEKPGATREPGALVKILRKITGRREVALRQDIASIYWQFPLDACPPEADLLAASETLNAALDGLWFPKDE